MAMSSKQRGKRTYYYTIIKSVFEGYDYLAALNQEIAEEAQSKAKSSFESIDIIQFPRTILGPSVLLEIRDDSALKYQVGLYRDGWYVQLLVFNTWPNSDIKEKVFGDKNISHVWTQETEKVPTLIAQLSKEAKRAIA